MAGFSGMLVALREPYDYRRGYRQTSSTHLDIAGGIMQTIKEWATEGRKALTESQVDPATHIPTDGEMNNLCYLSMKYLIGWQMRGCDFAVVKMVAGRVSSMEELTDRFIPALAEYMWDHICGEPDEPTVEDLTAGIEFLKDSLYTMNEHTRNSTEATSDPDNS